MTKDEFMTYVNYLNKLFKFEIPDKEVLPAWYKPFEKTHLQIAKKMADMYFQEEEGKFKLSKLIQYKSRAMNGVTYNEPKNESKCKLCKGTGFIQVEVPYRNTYTIKCKRCICEIGENLSHNIRQVTQEELERIDKNGRIIRDFKLHYNYEDNEDDVRNLDSLFERMKIGGLVK